MWYVFKADIGVSLRSANTSDGRASSHCWNIGDRRSASQQDSGGLQRSLDRPRLHSSPRPTDWNSCGWRPGPRVVVPFGCDDHAARGIDGGHTGFIPLQMTQAPEELSIAPNWTHRAASPAGRHGATGALRHCLLPASHLTTTAGFLFVSSGMLQTSRGRMAWRRQLSTGRPTST